MSRESWLFTSLLILCLLGCTNGQTETTPSEVNTSAVASGQDSVTDALDSVPFSQSKEPEIVLPDSPRTKKLQPPIQAVYPPIPHWSRRVYDSIRATPGASKRLNAIYPKDIARLDSLKKVRGDTSKY